MLAKLAFRNVRRSVRDYAIYFVTLVFGVAVFYAFNSVTGQSILFDLEDTATASVFEMTGQMLGMFSVVIACVLGFLVLYANGFLIRRRKQEFGTYLMLGMNPSSVSVIVLLETVAVGLVSLGVGLALGFALSQGLSFVTAGLFNIQMEQYRFVFSTNAFLLTLGCFVLIFAVTGLFNTLSIRRYKLIDLLSARSKNARFRVRNPWISLVGFLAAVAVIAWSYVTLVDNGLMQFDEGFWRATALMVAGTFLFFWSLAGFALAAIERTRGIYFKGLAMFTTRQIASKVNTAFLSLWAVCVLLFFSITVFSSGMGLVEVFVGGAERANPYSASLDAAVWYGPGGSEASSSGDPLERRAEMEAEAPDRLAQAESYNWDMAAALEEASPELWAETVGAWAQVSTYAAPDMTYDPLVAAAEATGADPEALRLDDLGSVRTTHLTVVSLSDFNGARALQGQEPVTLEAGTCALANNMEIVEPLARAVLDAAPTVTIAGKEYALAGPLYDTQLEDNAMAATAMIIVVPDEAVEALKAAGCIPDLQYLNVMYADNGKTAGENDAALADIVAALQPRDMGGFEKGTSGADDPYASLLWPVTRILTANEMLTQSAGLRLMITYLALYIGFIFLVSTAAILAIQQLSQTSDSAPRYRTLWKLGCDRAMINRSLLFQVLVYFLVPLGLAVCHSACAIGVLSDSMLDAIGVSSAGPITMAAALTLVIYGGYMLVTYLAARGIVKSSLQQG